jgi:hypothetical protein
MLSESPLTADDPETRQRAMALELLNLELELLEPWAAAGSFMTNVDVTDPNVVGAVLRTDRARLLMPTFSAPGAQYVPAQSAASGLSLVAPGVPESSNAYELTPGGIRVLRHKRVTGGVRVTLDDFGLTSLVLLAHDPLVINSLTQRAAALGPRAAELQRQLAARRFQVVEEVAAQLGGRTTAAQQSGAWLGAAREALQLCDSRLAAKDYAAAYLSAERALRALRLVERAYWDKAVEGRPTPLSSPAAATFVTLPWHWRSAARLDASRLGANRLPGGDFEDLDAMVRAGWRHLEKPAAGIETTCEFVADAAHSGRTGLRLSASFRPKQPNTAPPGSDPVPADAPAAKPTAAKPPSPPDVIETSPTWIITAPVPVEAGQLVLIRGWVQIPTPITGSVDGLMIVDSLGGEDLALRISKTTGWQPFSLLRVAPQSGALTVTFALTGLGEVRLDDVAIQVVEPAGAGGLTQHAPPSRPPR